MTTTRARRRVTGDGGAVLPELALMVPVIVTLVLGVLEYGQAYRQMNTVQRAATSAARTGSSIGDGEYADYEILRAIQTASSNLSNAEIDKVIVWEASSSPEVPPGCLNAAVSDSGPNGVADQCNVYTAAQIEDDSYTGFQRTGSGDDVDCANGSWDSRWCPVRRDDGRPDSDFVGVWIHVTYDGLTGIVPSDFSFDRSAIYQVEPDAYTGD